MRAQRPNIRVEGIAVAVWLSLAAGVALAWSWLFEVSFFLGPLIGLSLILAFAVLIIALAHGGHRKAFIVLTLGLTVILLLPLGRVGHWTWSWISLQQHRSAYEATISRAESLPDAGVYRGTRYVVGRGEPKRIAFPRSQGIPDGWSAVVHDPSGEIDAVRRRAVFGDRARSCIQITGPWHRCWFD